ncbi:hypothetical protein UCRNP2_5599 [Neofusicoccum parvum UCRNP2]|uniref:Uncharacterized protein n=1 Tax=Botryosphaeria parva (strain UCR-NP2) TaxID=1287680 RepID=R1EJE1_BOTPV|nr:hypothetical protein UCRNP2_5599 [Neofusicoccum parvum UCRNP2]
MFSEEIKPWDMSMKFPWNESTTGIDITFPVKAHSAVEARTIDRTATATASTTEGDGSSGTMTDSRVGAGGSVQTYDGATGMPKSEFRTKRFFDRIKTMWFRSGEFFRGFGAKKKNEKQETREWLQDSDVNMTRTEVYPGT